MGFFGLSQSKKREKRREASKTERRRAVRFAPLPCSRQIQTPRGNPNPSARPRRRGRDDAAMRGVRADGGGASSSSTAGDPFARLFSVCFCWDSAQCGFDCGVLGILAVSRFCAVPGALAA